MQTSRASEALGAQWFLTPFREKAFFLLFLSGSTFLQSDQTNKNAAAKTSLVQSVLTVTEALLLFYNFGYVNNCLQSRLFFKKVHWKTGSCVGMAIQKGKRA